MNTWHAIVNQIFSRGALYDVLICHRTDEMKLFLAIMISVTFKKLPNVYKRILLVKWKISTNLQKLPKMCWQFGQNNCCHRLWKVAQSVINRRIWSHWLWLTRNKPQMWEVQNLLNLIPKNIDFIQPWNNQERLS